MSTTTVNKPKLKLPHAEALAAKFCKAIEHVTLTSLVCGSIRRQKWEVGDIEIVCIPLTEDVQDGFFGKKKISLLNQYCTKFTAEQMPVSGDRYKKLIFDMPKSYIEQYGYPKNSQFQVDLFITTFVDYGRQVAIRTGSAFYTKVEIAKAWRAMGWVGTTDGLRRVEQCMKYTPKVWSVRKDIPDEQIVKPPILPDERSLYEWLGKQWVSPEKRSWEEQK